MSGLPKRRDATDEDLVALPGDLLGQIVEGELHATPRPAIDHQRASSTLGFDLGTPFDRGRGGHENAWLLVLTAGGDDVVRAEPFDAIELTLTGLWIRPS